MHLPVSLFLIYHIYALGRTLRICTNLLYFLAFLKIRQKVHSRSSVTTSPKSSHSEIIWSTRIYKAHSTKNVSLDVSGRGGTSYLPVIEYITANRQFRNAVLVCFMDGLGDKSIPKPLTYINLWVRHDDKYELSETHMERF